MGEVLPCLHRPRTGFTGSGLVLAITMGTINRYGGLTEVESTVGEGSRFVASFPEAARRAPG